MHSSRIAMVVFSHFPLDVRVRREAEALVEFGKQVDVICMRDANEARIEVFNGISIFRIRLDRKRGGKLRYFWEYGYFLLRAMLKLSLLHIRRRYRVVHIHNIPDILVYTAIIPKLTGAKIILDMHEFMPEFYAQKYLLHQDSRAIRTLKFLQKKAISFADSCIISVPTFGEKLRAEVSQPDKFTLILNVPELRYFIRKPLTKLKLDGRYRVIYPGTLSNLHGVDVAIRAVNIVRQETSLPIELHIYGSGPEKGNLEFLIEELSLADTVIFHEEVRVDQIGKVLPEMDVGVVPKRGGVFAGDAISTKLFDFAASGLPAVASRTKGDTFYFDDSMVLFFEPENERELAECLIRLYHDEKLRISLCRNSWELIEKMNWGVMKQDLIGLYEKLTDGKPAIPEKKLQTLTGDGMVRHKYVIVTPVKNEEKFIGQTISAVIDQEIRPEEWIVVDDGSTDRTREIISGFQGKYPWIRCLENPEVPRQAKRRAGGAAVIQYGLKKIIPNRYDFVVRMDSDVTFPPSFFRDIFSEFAKNAKLGIASGVCFVSENGEFKEEKNPEFHTRGPLKVYRSECYRDIGGLDKEEGWDTIDEMKANMLGWETRNFPDLRVNHLRKTQTASGALAGQRNKGFVSYYVGYHPFYAFLRSVFTCFKKPYIIGGAFMFFGYLEALLKKSRITDTDLVKYLRRQQINKILGKATIWR